MGKMEEIEKKAIGKLYRIAEGVLEETFRKAIQDAYDAGYEDGHEQGFEDGEKAAKDKAWQTEK